MRILPNDKNLEDAVLGAMMMGGDAVYLAMPRLFPEIFYQEANKAVFEAIRDLYDQNATIDLLTVWGQILKNGTSDKLEGVYYLTKLQHHVVSGTSIETHINLLAELYLKRKLAEIGRETEDKAYDPEVDAFDLANSAGTGIEKAQESVLNGIGKDLQAYVMEMLRQHSEVKKTGVLGLKTGLEAIDENIGGLVSPDLIVIAARPGQGKCLGHGTKVIMYDGTKKQVQDIEIGDLLMGVDSKPRLVLSLARGVENIYRIKQKKGIDYVVNESHILSLKRSRTENKHRNGDVLNIPVIEYLGKSNKFKTNYKGYKCNGFEMTQRNHLIDPYMIGLWLGDGTSQETAITNIEDEVIEYIDKFCIEHSLKIRVEKRHETSITYCLSGIKRGHNVFLSELKRLNLIGNKHIPYEYYNTSIKSRLLLLAGLIDTDGHYSNDNMYQITQKNKTIADDIMQLCQSVGLAVSTTTVRKKSQNGTFGTYYQMRIFGDIEKIPVKVERKKAKQRRQIKNALVTSIEIEELGLGNYYGFTLDKDGLFLLEDCTVTHNTALALSFTKNLTILGGVPGAWFSLEMDGVQLVRRLTSMISGIDHERIRSGRTNDQEDALINEVSAKISASKLFIEDKPSVNIRDIKTRAHVLHRKHKIKYIVVDYLQLMEGIDVRNKSREQVVSEISRGLKVLAKELGIPVIALSQLNRGVESRPDKMPNLSDLRESGAIEQDADEVIFIMRPEYYGIKEFTDEATGITYTTKELATLNIAKNRHGTTGNQAARFIGSKMEFSNIINSPF